ncbi:alpha/beta hydrolase [Aquibacillus kalidii]|uniref:alpha/beta hydrolase n=1 Tax=Aquibacillus kalidii TaxID=2762597 RepID=UPI001648CA6A|nr:alpha/beta hydrolase [Aquibacillus kalidii]
MEQTESWLKAKDQTNIHIVKWSDPYTVPKAIIQVSHGMVEHIERYKDFATFLVDHNIFVYGNDHRGHGKTGEKQGHLGHLSDINGFEKTSDDLVDITKLIQKEHPSTPIFLFGHSMGSFLVRRYIQKHHGLVKGVILSGTGFQPSFVTILGKALAKRNIKKVGKRTASKSLNKLVFGNYQKHLQNTTTEFDWLSRDKEQVQNYINDPFTGFIPTATFFYDLFDGLHSIHQKQNIEKMDKDIPILFISGEQDPVGNRSKGVLKVMEQFNKIGMNHVDQIFYPEARHELLQETNKHEVYQDVLDWLNDQINEK